MRSTWGLLIALLVTVGVLCSYLLYRVMDLSVSLDHAWAEHRQVMADRQLLRALLEDLSKGQHHATTKPLIVGKYSTSHVVKEENGVLWVDGVGLRFAEEKLTGVMLLNDQK
jgi:hypothetical protein